MKVFSFLPHAVTIGVCALVGAHVYAANPTVQPDPGSGVTGASSTLLLRWVDARGNLYKGVTVQSTKWVWSKQSDKDPFESPALRITLESQLPSDWKATRVTADGVTIAEPLTSGSRQRLTIDLRTARGALRFEFLTATGKKIELVLVSQVSLEQPYVMIRPECGKHDLRFIVHKAKAKHLYVGLNCVDRGDSFDIYFFRSKDGTWNRTEGLLQFDPENKYLSFRSQVKKPKDQVVYSQQLFRAGTVDETGGMTEYSVVYNPRLKPKRFFLSAGLGFTHYNYSETLPNLKMTQISLTGKVNLGIRLVPKVIDVAFNFFGNIIALKNSPDTFEDGTKIPPARFYGLNGRIGYRLPVDMGATEFFFLTGWYFWGMRVPGVDESSSYGIKTLSGPQLFFMMVNSQAGKAGWWFYTKYAMIADKFALLSTTNRELAAGVGIELSAREKKPFAITFDAAHAQYANEENGMTLLSLTLGVQKSF